MTANEPTTTDFEDMGAVTVAWSQRYRLVSRFVDQAFQIEVAWPPVAPQAGQRFPVVFVLDGNHSFAMAAGAARAIQSGPFPLPPTLVVGIGYHFERPEHQGQWGHLRLRDFTPCGDALYEEQTQGARARTGGAADFLRFVQEELKPFLAARLPMDDSDSTLVGASLGGMFALQTLFTQPDAFQRYVAISPAIYWGGGRIFELEGQHAASATDLAAKLHLAAGALEEAHDARQGFVSNLLQLEARLRARRYPSLDLSAKVHEGETHMSVFPGAVTRGLGAVFGGYRDMSDWSRWLAMA